MGKNNDALVPIERIENKILLIRSRKVMLDRDLAELYGVPTKVFNQAIRRNMRRFPPKRNGDTPQKKRNGDTPQK